MMGSKARARRRLSCFLSVFVVTCLLQYCTAGVTKNNSCKKVGTSRNLLNFDQCPLNFFFRSGGTYR